MHELETQETKKAQEIHSISTSAIVPNPNQPRKVFTEDSILKLADSIKQFGIIQPITVRKAGEIYELVSGERRLRAAKELNMTAVPCIITNISEEKSAQISIIENLIREDLNIFEQALAIETLIDTYGLTQEQVAEKLSNSQSFVANKLRLLRLSKEEREIILENKLTERHARALLRIFDAEKRKKVLEQVINEGLNVANTEVLIDSIVNNNNAFPATPIVGKGAKGYRDIPSFCNAVNRAIECAKTGNLDIKSRKIVGEHYTEITIIIPNAASEDQSADVSRETSTLNDSQ